MLYSIGDLRPPKWQTSVYLLFSSFISSWWYGKGKPALDGVCENSGWSCFSLNAEGNSNKVGTENHISLWCSSWHRASSASQVNSHLYCNCCNLSSFLSLFSFSIFSFLSFSFSFPFCFYSFSPPVPIPFLRNTHLSTLRINIRVEKAVTISSQTQYVW